MKYKIPVYEFNTDNEVFIITTIADTIEEAITKAMLYLEKNEEVIKKFFNTTKNLDIISYSDKIHFFSLEETLDSIQSKLTQRIVPLKEYNAYKEYYEF